MTSRGPSNEALLERSVLRVAKDEAFLASALREWSGGNLNVDAAMTFFGCSRSAILQLALCRRPDANASTFRADVMKIAAHAGVDDTRLLALLREVIALSVFRKGGGSQLLAAARDERGPRTDGDS